MQRTSFIVSLLLALALILAACSSELNTNNNGTPTTTGITNPQGTSELPNTGLQGTPGLELNATPAITSAPTLELPVVSATPAATESPTMTETITSTPAISATGTTTGTLRGAMINPASGRQDLIRLSNWMNFKVVDRNNQDIGRVQDYIVNTCEAHILYMVVQSGPALNLQGGTELLIPYEAVSVNGGTLNAENKTITLNLDASQVSGAPNLNQRPDLSTTDWEGPIRDFWGGIVQLSNLDTTCSVTPVGNQEATSAPQSVNVHKIAYASDLLKARLQDANQNDLGQVKDAIVEPESDQIFYLAVDLQGNAGTVLIPMRAVNLPENANEQAGQFTLVLLVDNNVLQGAPKIDSLNDLNTNVNPEANNYWSQYIPLNQGQ